LRAFRKSPLPPPRILKMGAIRLVANFWVFTRLLGLHISGGSNFYRYKWKLQNYLYVCHGVSWHVCTSTYMALSFLRDLKIYIRVLGVTKSAYELRHVLFIVRLSVSTRINRAPTGRISIKFVNGDLHENREVLNSVKIKKKDKKIVAFCMKTQESVIVGGGANLYKTIFVLHSVVLYCWCRSKRHTVRNFSLKRWNITLYASCLHCLYFKAPARICY